MKDIQLNTNIPLATFFTDKLKENGIKGRVKTTDIVKYFKKYCEGETVFPINNSNDHNYSLYNPIVISKATKFNVSDIDFTTDKNGYIIVSDFVITKLLLSGNSIYASDLEISSSVSQKDFLSSLKLLKEILESEILFLEKYNGKDKNEMVLKTLINLINEPVGTLNFLKVAKVIDEDNETIIEYRKKKEFIALVSMNQSH